MKKSFLFVYDAFSGFSLEKQEIGKLGYCIELQGNVILY